MSDIPPKSLCKIKAKYEKTGSKNCDIVLELSVLNYRYLFSSN